MTSIVANLTENASFEIKSLYNFFLRLKRLFGVKYLFLLCAVYGVLQGMTSNWVSMATDYKLSDARPGGFEFNNDKMQRVNILTDIPWHVMCIYGLLSDFIPISGFHRSVYLGISSFVGFVSWGCLYLNDFLFPNALPVFGTFLFLGKYGMANPSVLLDADIAQKGRDNPDNVSDLQTLSAISIGLGNMLSTLTAGFVVHRLGNETLYGLSSLALLIIFVPSCLGFLGESRIREHAGVETVPSRNPCCSCISTGSCVGEIGSDCRGHAYPHSVISLIKFSVLQASVSLGLGLINILGNSYSFLIGSAAIVALLVSYFIIRYIGGVNLTLAKVSLFIFISRAVQPDHTFIFLWQKQSHDNGCYSMESSLHNASDTPGLTLSRPCFTAEFISFIRFLSSCALIVGSVAYNRYFSHWSYRSIWYTTQLLLCIFGFLDIVWVKRWNILIGIPDKFFSMGDKVIVGVIDQLNQMPMYVLAAVLCPPGMEATVFAANMSLHNLGWDISAYAGIFIQELFGGIAPPAFANLGWFLLICSLCRLLPILFVPLLIPPGSPRSREHEFTSLMGSRFVGNGIDVIVTTDTSSLLSETRER